MNIHVNLPKNWSPRRQGRLLAFGMTGAMALAVTSCGRSDNEVTIAPPANFDPNQASIFTGNTNQAPTNSVVYTYGNGGYMGAHGYYPVYGYPNYYYRPAPGSTAELVTGGSSGYRAGSPAEAHDSIARGGFGGHGGGEGGGE